MKITPEAAAKYPAIWAACNAYSVDCKEAVKRCLDLKNRKLPEDFYALAHPSMVDDDEVRYLFESGQARIVKIDGGHSLEISRLFAKSPYWL